MFLEPQLEYRSLRAALEGGRGLSAGGLWGSSAALVIAGLAAQSSRPLWILTPGPDDADALTEDLRAFGVDGAVVFPDADDALPGSPGPAAALRLLGDLARGRPPRLAIASFTAILRPVPDATALRRDRLRIAHGDRLPPERLAAALAGAGYERIPRVETPGQFAVRGGLTDLFPLGGDAPLRVEFDGDRIDSLRTFDPETQRSSAEIPTAEVELVALPPAGPETPAETPSPLDLLPPDASVVVLEPAEIAARWGRPAEGEPPARTARVRRLLAALSARPTLSLSPLPLPETPGNLNVRVRSVQRFTGRLAGMAAEFTALAADGGRILVYGQNQGELLRLEELRAAGQLGASPAEFRAGSVRQGFQWPDANPSTQLRAGLTVLTYAELFNRPRARRRIHPASTGSRPVDTFLDLERGDIVVHLTHGIGRYLGLEVLRKDGTDQEFVALEFEGHARLYVPVSNLDLVQKYVGGGGATPPLSALGGAAWEARKDRARQAVEKLAGELLEVQALREAGGGAAYPADPPWQSEFEAAFPYDDTPDQAVAVEAVAKDMRAPRPMDRLLCGDVGFGKTEIAVRAAFRAAVHGRQCAVLVPTTVLAQQHGETFRDRMAGYPVAVEVLSRLQSPADQRRILAGLAAGSVDVVIGTHRLLGGDVRFRDLGLVVIDEEQRFGVEHKERLKRFRATVDVLTLTATPIPRTLHMALLGIRDISTLATPPRLRRAVRTEVRVRDDRQIREAIRRELERKGQAFYLHNRVYDIDDVKSVLEGLVPEASFASIHGQMDADLIEERMLAFLERKVDVLVTTTIIESGLDIPNANTIFVDDADRFGLADLHQLRGRVGRYHHQAYAYFLLPRDRPILPEARKRLKAIEEFADLGAGFKIALQDLEIRGAGNLLGAEQHGHIAAIGYELYCRMLQESARRIRREPPRDEFTSHLDLHVGASIPETYVDEADERMRAYRTLCRARTVAEAEAVADELKDRFGPPPGPVRTLLRLTRIRLRAQAQRLREITRGDGALILRYADPRRMEEIRRRHASVVRVIDDTTAHIVLSAKKPGPEEMLRRLESVLPEIPNDK